MTRMKRIILLIILVLSFNLYGQFPSPNDFCYKLDYIELDQWGVCNGQTVYGPSYCSHFVWRILDTSSTEAFLEYFEIYNIFNGDTTLIHSLSDTTYTTTTPYEGDLYVIAVYSNPSGKSEPSNIINNPGIPIGIKETDYIPEITIKYNLQTEFLEIESNKSLADIKIFNSKGQIIYNEENINTCIFIGNLKPGIYIIEIIDNVNHIYRDKIIKK